jgi:hypothetical protein
VPITQIPPEGLKDSGVSAGTYGSASQIPVVTVNSKGQVTSAGTAALDLSTKINKAGDTMTGTLSVPRLQVASTANYIDMVDTDWGTRSFHHNQGLMGFLKSDGNWDMYMNNGGQMWTANYGWLHDCFFSNVSNCVRVNNNPSSGWQGAPNCQITDNCYNCGDQAPYNYYNLITLFDNGGNLRLGAYGTRYNCNCDCNCC